VIVIDIEQCTGCAACVEVCPTGALYLVDGKATVDKALCHGCEACLAACPSEAIILTEQAEPMAAEARLPALRPEAEVIRVRTQAAPVPFRSRVLPLACSALVLLEREILPWVADLLDRRTIQRQTSKGARSRETPALGAEGNGHQHRHRRRRGNR
jgi:ferredoxin